MVKSFYIGVAIIENNESDCAIVRIDSDNSVICTFNIMNDVSSKIPLFPARTGKD